MSSRQMKQQLRLSLEQQEDSDDEADIHNLSTKKKTPSFNLLMVDSEDDEETMNEGDTKAEERKVDPEIKPQFKHDNVNTTKKKKKKKKKKKRKEMHHENDEDLDKIFAEFEQPEPHNEVEGEFILGQGSSVGSSGLFSVSRRYLNASLEMQRKFQVGSSLARETRQQRKGVRRWAGVLVEPKPTWPMYRNAGLSMQCDNRDNASFFTLVHNPSYQEVELQFFRAQRTLDPQAISHVLHAHPYHVNCLLQMAEVCRMSGDLQMAGDLIERAVFVLEGSFHTSFLSALASATARVDYRVFENRAFFLAIFHHIQYVSKKGCWQSAFELAKMLLAVDSEKDPLAVSLLIDYLALRAGQEEWLISLFELWDPVRKLCYLPNFALSTALAHFFTSLEQEDKGKTGSSKQHKQQADFLLKAAIIQFPAFVPLLAEALSATFRPDIMQHEYFKLPVTWPQPQKGLILLIKTYVHWSKSIWKPEHILNWLQDICIEIVSGLESQEENIMLQRAAAEERRNTLYAALPLNIQRHVLICDIPGTPSLLPPSTFRQSVQSHDPLPPADGQSLPYLDRLQPSSAPSYSGGVVGAFFQSLLPNFNTQDQAEQFGPARQQARPDQDAPQINLQAMRDSLFQVFDRLRSTMPTFASANDQEFEYTEEELADVGIEFQDDDEDIYES